MRAVVSLPPCANVSMDALCRLWASSGIRQLSPVLVGARNIIDAFRVMNRAKRADIEGGGSANCWLLIVSSPDPLAQAGLCVKLSKSLFRRPIFATVQSRVCSLLVASYLARR
jgi:hypothetical protein